MRHFQAAEFVFVTEFADGRADIAAGDKVRGDDPIHLAKIGEADGLAKHVGKGGLNLRVLQMRPQPFAIGCREIGVLHLLQGRDSSSSLTQYASRVEEGLLHLVEHRLTGQHWQFG